MSYSDFLSRKVARADESGPVIDRDAIHPMLHDWQAELVQWATSVGRAAIWADTGLGKTVMQVEWARHVAGDGVVLILAPLAVCHQTVRMSDQTCTWCPFLACARCEYQGEPHETKEKD